jgi:Zn finger protein HypA/HybF involved in hydrogenase expression
MKVSCPNCQKVFNAPSEWGGRKVKCPGCKGSVSLPKADEAATKELGFDLGSLSGVEQVGEAIVREKAKPMTLKEAQAVTAAAKVAAGNGEKVVIDPTVRICPGCGERVRSAELYSDLICRHCGVAIPGLELAQTETRYTTLSDRISTGLKFYSGFGGAALYPIPAIGSISIGMVIALAAIAVPLFPILGFTGASGANEASKSQSDFGWVGIFLTVMFAIEALYFGAVAYYVMVDTIRTTTSGAEQPPPLTWSPTKLGGALGGYAALIGFYCLIVFLLFMTRIGEMPSSAEDFGKLMSDPVSLLVLALLTFGVPMNLIGLASTHSVDGLNPLKFGPSIGRTLGHYTFLFLITVLYLGFYVGVMFAIMSWAGPTILNASTKDSEAGLAKIMLSSLMGLAAWSVLIGMMLYFGYCLGRVLGLYSRTYRGKLTFEL